MRKGVFLFTLIALMMFVSSTQSVMATGEPAGPNDCDTPSVYLSIKADAINLAYDKTELKAAKGACVQLTFTNPSAINEHDFKIDADTDSGFPAVYVYSAIADNVAKNVTFKVPDVDVTVEFYCSVEGHRDGGMKGEFVVGEGSKTPGFEFSFALLAISVLVTIPILRRRK